jgi:hypothetical protein
MSIFRFSYFRFILSYYGIFLFFFDHGESVLVMHDVFSLASNRHELIFLAFFVFLARESPINFVKELSPSRGCGLALLL